MIAKMHPEPKWWIPWCKHAKSQSTPCYRRDGDSAVCIIGEADHCVGCEHSVEWLKEEKTT
jgi:hypothetical protein